MDGRFSELELTFIKEVLDIHGEYMSDLLSDAIEKKNLIKDGYLQDAIHYQVLSYGINPALLVSFPDYGRFIEIRYHQKSQNTRFWLDSHASSIDSVWGRKNKIQRRRKKKDTRWYARTAYGSVNRLVAMLMNEFTEEEKKRLQHIIESQKTRTK